mgnify:CR=1 FL=1
MEKQNIPFGLQLIRIVLVYFIVKLMRYCPGHLHIQVPFRSFAILFFRNEYLSRLVLSSFSSLQFIQRNQYIVNRNKRSIWAVHSVFPRIISPCTGEYLSSDFPLRFPVTMMFSKKHFIPVPSWIIGVF